MRTLFLLLFAAFALTGCEDTETNSPALQAKIDNILFRAADARAELNTDGTVTLRGLTADESLVLTIISLNEGVYNLGGNSGSSARFESFQGVQYTTNPDGDGQVVVQNAAGNTLSGTFFFNASSAGGTTLFVSEGVFFGVPIVNGNIGGDDPTTNSLSAKVNGGDFNPAGVNVVDSGNNILIAAATTAGETISLTIPESLVPDVYDITTSGISAVYLTAGQQSVAASGSLTIINHDTAAQTMNGTFAFETGPPDNISITEGQFSITY